MVLIERKARRKGEMLTLLRGLLEEKANAGGL